MNTDTPVPAVSAAGPPPLVIPESPPPMEQIPAAELAELRRRAERYRFLFKTIVTVTSILVGATLIVVLVALLTDM